MKSSISLNLISGIIICLFGLFCFLYGYEYEFGSLSRIGPGFFPKIVSLIIIILGFLISISKTDQQISIDYRSLFVCSGSIVIFALCIKFLGLLPAIFFTILSSLYAQREKISLVKKIKITSGITVFILVLFKIFFQMNTELLYL